MIKNKNEIVNLLLKIREKQLKRKGIENDK